MKVQNCLLKCYLCALTVDKDRKIHVDDYSHPHDSDIEPRYTVQANKSQAAAPVQAFSLQVQWNCSFFILQSVRVALKHCVALAMDSK